MEVDLVGEGALTEVAYCIEIPECGNGVVEDGEECDDGNGIDYDLCRNDCTLPACNDVVDYSCSQDVFDALAGTGSNSGDVYHWCFEFEDGWSDCGFAFENSAMIHDMLVHLSCSADYDENGYPSKDHPQEALGEPAVISYSIRVWDVDINNQTCDYKKDCGMVRFDDECGGKCYLIGNLGGANGGDDLLTRVNPSEFDPLLNEINVGTGTGTFNTQSIAFHPVTEVLYGSNANQLGTIDLYTGVFTPLPSVFGTAGGALGEIPINDVDGLSFDTHTGTLYGSVRRAGPDLLIQIDPSTGAHVPEAFGTGIDYVAISPVFGLDDIDDIAIDITNGNMFAVANSNDLNDRLILIDKSSGVSTDVGIIGVNNMEGLGFDTDGTLYGSQGGAGRKLYEINKASGIAFSPRTIDNADDYEGFDCFVALQEPPCGNGIVDPGEECDDGNDIDTDECRNDCTLPHCGDGIVDPGEMCDDGNDNNFDECRNDCTYPECGDGILDPGEECDDGNTIDNDGCSNECTRESVKIVAHKIVCGLESDLPNWGLGGPNIGSATATNYIAQNDNCVLKENWLFQWGDNSVTNPGDMVGEVDPSTGWTTFGPTDANGKAEVTISSLDGISQIKVREVFETGYIPFTYQDDNSNISAEMYCHDDVINYDNYDSIYNPVYDNTYYCIAFNVLAPYCPNGVVDPGEECDDGNMINNDECRNDCTTPKCPDGILDPGEECDDGNMIDTDNCRNDCTIPDCPDGRVDPGEECDDGNMINDDDCRNDCTLPDCPDGILDPGEECDDGNLIDTDDCRNDCTIPDCPDGRVDPGEECDDGNLNNFDDCRNNCTRPYCPDGIKDADEECDDGNLIDTDGCRNDCTLPYCPDGILDPGEQCDDGNLIDWDDCRNDCTLPYCPDGKLDPGEQCDDGNTNNNDSCRNDCTIPECGDGIIDLNEECDPPGVNGQCEVGSCSEDCTCPPPPTCGNGTIDPGEQCDPPGAFDQCTYGVCNDSCLCPPPPTCGNGVIELGEECDPPGASGQCASGLCSGSCTCTPPPFCGDGNLDPGEQCDPPGLSGLCPSGLCLGNCVCEALPTCGDGVLNEGEECDPPGVLGQCAFGACIGNCTCPIEPPPTPFVPTPPGCGIIFGANEFILSAQASPISSHGIIQFNVGEPQRFYIEAKNVNKMTVINLESGEEFELDYNTSLKLWTGILVFNYEGQFRLVVHAENEECEYSREINTIYVIEKPEITDLETGRVLTNSSVTVYEKEPYSNNFNLWEGQLFGMLNPYQPEDGELGIVLPRGEFYLQIEAPGYNTVTSLITVIEDHSIVTASVKMKPLGNLWDRFITSLQRNSETNNFSLQVTTMPGTYLLPIGEEVADIDLHDKDNMQYNLFSLLEQDKPTVLFVYSSWNTLANEQVNMYKSIVDRLGDKYQFIPLTTMEPDNVNKAFLARGEYPIRFYKPADQFFHDYHIISLPQFFLLDEDRKLVNIITGPQAYEELIRKIEVSYEEE
jgi:cysteine-rich repeat protein